MWAFRFKSWRRNHKHMSQREFARALGVSRSTVEAIEAGKRKPSRITVIKFEMLKEKHATKINLKPIWEK